MKKEVRKRSTRWETYKNTQREKGNSKIAGNCPWALQRANIVLKKSIEDVCCKYGDKKERARARGGPKRVANIGRRPRQQLRARVDMEFLLHVTAVQNKCRFLA